MREWKVVSDGGRDEKILIERRKRAVLVNRTLVTTLTNLKRDNLTWH